MKNLFDYATRELSQDAFLCWLFANYDCEQPEVSAFSRYMLYWLITDKLALESIDKITEVIVKKQYKNIDILIECECSNSSYIIVIEDKINTTVHNCQLDRYKETIYKEYSDNFQKRFIFYKTDIIGKMENTNLKNYAGWSIKQVKDIYEVFHSFLEQKNLLCFNNEILNYYYEKILNILDAITNRPEKVSKWISHSWHSFFEEYIPVKGLLQNAEINNYQNKYYFYKFSIDEHKEDFPSIEIRSRDYKNGKLKFRIVLYSVSPQNITEENMTKWKNILAANGIKLCNRTEMKKNKQIGIFEKEIVDDTETSLYHVFNEVGKLLINLYGQKQ